jgi:hypothetical protein
MIKLLLGIACATALTITSASGSVYVLDNGSPGNGYGPNADEAIVLLNNFTVQSGFNVINSVEAHWYDLSGNGHDPLNATAGVWSDPNQDGNPIDAVLLGSSALTLSAGAGFQTFDLLSAIDVGAAGTSFFVGMYWMDDASGQLALNYDTSTGLDRSWQKEYFGDPLDPNNLSGSEDFGGNFMIRANAVPAPGVLALLGLGGLAGTRRNRVRCI